MPNGQNGQNNQGGLNGGENPLPLLRRHSTGDPTIDAIYYLADVINNNPSLGRRNYDPTRQSQSQISTGHDWSFNRVNPRHNRYRSSGNILDDFENGIREELLNAIAGGDFRKGIQGALSQFTQEFGFELHQLPNMLGRYFGKELASSKLGKAFTGQVQKLGDKLLKSVFNLNDSDQKAAFNALKRVFGRFFNGGAGGGATGGGGTAGAGLANGSLSTAELKGLAKGVKGIAPVGIALAVFIALTKPVLEGIGDFIKAWGAAFNRDEDTRRKRLKNAQERLAKDMEILAKEPFNILIDAAKEWETTWDETLKNISLTQGYTKENVYALYESVAKQLKADGFENTIAATDVIKNLNQILQTGLSGAVAEAFAYQSTWLSAVMPTEDFTSYAATYAQLATDAMNSGLSQADAIEYANLQLQEFASNLLYSSRTLTGGFTTGLKDAESLFKNAVDIAQTAKTHNVAEISGTLTAVSGVIGAVAPDLAQGLVENVVNAAIGGNETSIVALRSLAGINAGNTDFLRQMATNPQGVFEAIFRNLGNMQNMSPSNYMEVAEGLSKVFGVDMKAFARVDFNQLADKIADMQVNQASLEENLALFQTGEATLTKDQLRYQEINNDILENGLAYVIDNEYGRMIQQHMWDEQIANAMAENEYAVSIQGAALTYLEGLRHTVANILNFLNPIGYIADGIARIEATKDISNLEVGELADILEKGKVGGGNATMFRNLTDYTGKLGEDTPLAKPLVELLGGTSNVAARKNELYQTLKNNAQWTSVLSRVFFPEAISSVMLAYNMNNGGGTDIPLSGSAWNIGVDELGGTSALGYSAFGMGNISDIAQYSGYRNLVSGARSSYSGFGVGKDILSLSGSSASGTAIGSPLVTSATAEDFATSLEEVNHFIEGAEAYVTAKVKAGELNTISYNEYVKSANFNLVEGLKEYNLTEEEFKDYFEGLRSGASGQREEDRKDNIQAYIKESRDFWGLTSDGAGTFKKNLWEPFYDKNDGTYITNMNLVHTALSNIQGQLGDEETEATVIYNLDKIKDSIGASENNTVISLLEKIESDLDTAFIQSPFEQCLEDWLSYVTSKGTYKETVNSAQAWADLKSAEEDQKNETLLALANAMNAFSDTELQGLDPQLQANVLLGKIIIILEAIMQQNNSSIGGFGLGDSISAIGMGIMTK